MESLENQRSVRKPYHNVSNLPLLSSSSGENPSMRTFSEDIFCRISGKWVGSPQKELKKETRRSAA